MARKIVHQPKSNATPQAKSGSIAEAFGTRLDILNCNLGFCRAIVDILCFEKKSEATDESFETVKFKLWELVGEAEDEAEKLSMDLRNVVVEAMAVQS